MNPLERLRRKDKWFLGGGTGSIYAPVFPQWLSTVGFWDESYFADVRLQRLFIGLFFQNGKACRLQSRTVDWRPDRLLLEHASDNLKLLETRLVLPCHSWVSMIEVLKSGSDPVDVALWSLQAYDPTGVGTPWQSITSVEVMGDFLQYRFDTAWPLDFKPDRTAVDQEALSVGGGMGRALPLYMTLGADKPARSRFVQHAQRHFDGPLHETCALLGGELHTFVGGGLLGDDPELGFVHLGLTYSVGEGETIVLGSAAGLSSELSMSNLETALGSDPAQASENSWKAFFGGVPQFESSDPYLTNAYWYRWYGLRLNTVSIPDLPNAESSQSFSPFVTEGVGFFRNFVTYSAQAHLREVAWMHDPALALGIVDNLVRIQRSNGSYPGHNYSCRPSRDFYHADFATGCELLEALHGSVVSPSVAESLARSLMYFVEARWAKNRAGFMVFDQNETGQEYMNRYLFANPNADQWESFRIVGVEATVYVLRLARLVQKLGLQHDRKDWIELADKALSQTRASAYDSDSRYLCDSTEDGLISPARPATGLYGLSENGLGHNADQTQEMIRKWLSEPGLFRRGFGFFAEAATEPTFDSLGSWKGKRLNCPWNGRSWPMANSHIVDELATVARSNPEFCALAGEALMGCIRMMFHEGDPDRPNSYEHYDPLTGQASVYRGYDDYMHSWIVDLILRHAVGYQPDTKSFDPLPLAGVEWIECSGIPDPSGLQSVRIENGRAV
ncbi:MAG: hypothetical protein KF784_10270 [Fimbriimonadaceae bacterium]|nr:hypothetical protein [Fimbriimonadaceae bacterium]